MTGRLRSSDLPPRSPRGDDRRAGIALMVVMVVFVILYLVVFQLHYTTRVYEREAKNRASAAQGSVAISSMAYAVISLLAEDYNQGQGGGSAAGTGTGLATAEKVRGEDDKKDAIGGGTRKESSPGGEPGGAVAGAAGAPTWFDYLRENLFLDNQQSLNGMSVKICMVDNERKFDWNRLWEYVPSHAETLSESNEEEARKDESKAKTSKDSTKNSAKKSSSRTSSAGKEPGEETAAEGLTLDEVGAGLTWEPPTEDVRREAAKIVERSVDMMYRLNTENGFEYRMQPPAPAMLADAIERYAFDRRSQPAQNYIHLTSELLNVLGYLQASPEVYYGPIPELREGEEFYDRNGMFRYTRDQFGDLTGEYVDGFVEEALLEREAMLAELAELEKSFPFRTFPEYGRMANPLTRNTQEFAEVEDEQGNISLAVPPMPIGLKDLFCTFSTGKINLNTAPVPVLYALLPLIIDTEQGGEIKAQGIALNIEQYRNSYAPEGQDPSAAGGTGGTVEEASQKGKSKRPSRKESADLLKASGAAGAAGLTDQELAGALEGTSTDYPTQYFKSLTELKLIDGEDGGPEDYLTEEGGGTTTADLSQKTPLQKVLHDYGQMMVFGSTYFTATIKGKSPDSSLLMVGEMTILRDIPRRRMEVVQWKHLGR